MKKILIVGAGAIGRGFLAPLLQNYNFEISFYDQNEKLVTDLNKNKYFHAAITGQKNYNFKKIKVDKAYDKKSKINISIFDIVFCCVGPKQCISVAKLFKRAKTVISCENDFFSVQQIKKISGNKNVFFGIPDVITSSTAPTALLKKDKLTTVSERGELILEKGNYKITKQISQVGVKSLEQHWRAKLFIHNAPHAILAYLGHLKKYKYIHEAMADKRIKKIVLGAMREITDGVIKAKYVPKKFAEYYMKKEIRRFSNLLLFDPISRVAREPIRKLGKENRIILALRVSQWNKKLPVNIAIGVKAALEFNDKNDPESKYLQSLRKKLDDDEVLEMISGIERTDPLNTFCLEQSLDEVLSD